MDSKKLGDYGEKLAIDFLKKKGYKILDKNFFTRFGEIDIVAQDQNDLVFVEVKTRTNTIFGYPESAVNNKKIRHMTRMVDVYIQKRHISNVPVRIDVISVEMDQTKDNPKIEHFINITSF